MRKDVIIFCLIALGIGWAAWMDYKRVDPNWKDDQCHGGISYSLHQRESDERWVIGIRNRYMERLAVTFKIEWKGGSEEKTGLLRQGEIAYFFAEHGEGATAKITRLHYAAEDGTVLGEIECE